MGTRINVLFPHELSDWRDRDAVLTVLNTTIAAAKSLEAVWSDSSGNTIAQDDLKNEWIAEPPFPPPETRDYHRYSGPGPLFVEVNPLAVRVRTGGRWHGFESVQAIRVAHLQAFDALVTAFGSNTYICCADNDFVNDVFWDGGGGDECSAVLTHEIGPPVESASRAMRTANVADNGIVCRWYRVDLAN